MKKLVGQRANPDPGMKEAVALVECLMPGGPHPSVREHNVRCAFCGAPIRITMSETASNGEIWLEGPDNCPACGQKIVDENAPFQPLSQETIQSLFGKF